MSRFKILEDEIIVEPTVIMTELFGKKVVAEYKSFAALIHHSGIAAYRTGSIMGMLSRHGYIGWADSLTQHFTDGLVLEDEGIVIKAYLLSIDCNLLAATMMGDEVHVVLADIQTQKVIQNFKLTVDATTKIV